MFLPEQEASGAVLCRGQVQVYEVSLNGLGDAGPLSLKCEISQLHLVTRRAHAFPFFPPPP